jgi:putative phosphoribosyl transferase
MKGNVTAVRIPAGGKTLDGELSLPEGAAGVVLFAHGSGSSRHSPRNQFVARTLQEAGLGTLLFDLLTESEEREEARTRHLRFDLNLLAERLVHATDMVAADEETKHLRQGLFGSSTGGGAALMAAAVLPNRIGAVVSRGGRPDLAGPALRNVRCPTLLIVGGEDNVVINLNEQAMMQMSCKKDLIIIPGASHLFEEPGTLEQVAQHAADWFNEHLHGEAR